MTFDLKKGYVLVMSSPGISLLFTNQCYLRLFANSYILDKEEKLEQFKIDFSNCVPNTNIRYYVLNNNINIRHISSLSKYGINYCNINDLDNYDYDENGYIRYVYIFF